VDDVADPLAPERAAFVAAIRDAIDASLDGKRARDNGDPAELLGALRAMIATQVATLAAHDRLVRRAQELGMRVKSFGVVFRRVVA
jgi:hypothetical protein